MKNKYLCLYCLFLVAGLLPFTYSKADNLPDRLKGRILLQVEQNGEAWYVNPADGKRHYMGRPEDALDLMRKLGLGISNLDIRRIPVGDKNLLNGPDSDGDGLSDMIEDAFGTDKHNPDSDGDGYDDKIEILAGFDPLGPGRLPIDHDFSDKQRGKILIQVEQNGEAWYVNPEDGKRYFLGRPTDAFSIMRSFGLGIRDNDLAKISKRDSDLEKISKQETLINCGKAQKSVYEEKGYFVLNRGMDEDFLNDEALKCFGQALLTEACPEASVDMVVYSNSLTSGHMHKQESEFRYTTFLQEDKCYIKTELLDPILPSTILRNETIACEIKLEPKIAEYAELAIEPENVISIFTEHYLNQLSGYKIGIINGFIEDSDCFVVGQSSQSDKKCELDCEKYVYSDCPEGCVANCYGSGLLSDEDDEDGNFILFGDDCDGSMSCACP